MSGFLMTNSESIFLRDARKAEGAISDRARRPMPPFMVESFDCIDDSADES